MTPDEGRDYLRTAADTETGRRAIRAVVGAAAEVIIADPTAGDDRSTITLAERVAGHLARDLARLN